LRTLAAMRSRVADQSFAVLAGGPPRPVPEQIAVSDLLWS
jgi:hypothetical protein